MPTSPRVINAPAFECPTCGQIVKNTDFLLDLTAHVFVTSRGAARMSIVECQMARTLCESYPVGVTFNDFLDAVYNERNEPEFSHQVVYNTMRRVRNHIRPLGWDVKAMGRRKFRLAKAEAFE